MNQYDYMSGNMNKNQNDSNLLKKVIPYFINIFIIFGIIALVIFLLGKNQLINLDNRSKIANMIIDWSPKEVAVIHDLQVLTDVDDSKYENDGNDYTHILYDVQLDNGDIVEVKYSAIGLDNIPFHKGQEVSIVSVFKSGYLISDGDGKLEDVQKAREILNDSTDVIKENLEIIQ